MSKYQSSYTPQSDASIFVRTKPPPFSLKTFLYNSRENTICGRKKLDWSKIN